MHQWMADGGAEVPSELLQLTTSTGSGSLRIDTNSTNGSGGDIEGSEDKSLDLWLSISIPLICLLALVVVMFFCCKRKKKKQQQQQQQQQQTLINTNLESPSLPMYHRGRRRGGPNNRMAILTSEDEEALASWRIDVENIEPLNPLGAGVYGTVWLATYMGETVVVKKLSPPMPTSLPRTKSWRKTNRQSVDKHRANSGTNTAPRTKSRVLSGKSALRRFLVDIRFLSTLSHPKIVAFYGVAWTSPSKLDVNNEPTGNASDVQMVLEYMSCGDLRDYLARTRSDARARAWGPRKLSMALDIAEALAYLHSRQPRPVLHCGLKSRNILLDSTYTAKVSDFGFSRYGITQSMGSEEDDDDSDEHFAMTNSIGTNRWIAPEVLSGNSRYSTAVDMYSFGVILSELDSHDLPFSDITLSSGQPLPESAVVELLRTGAIRPSLSDRCPRGVEMLVMACLNLEPKVRPTAAQTADRLRALLESERRVSDIGDDVSTSDQNSFLGAKEDIASVYSSSINSSVISIERGFNYAVLEER
ncbi:unnamed protein product [Peronospora belbahrii]|uniref:Protein kinase domain-containing protein n=1 Tax=Peronospora belbahrii TaxID=622444 RepID=A0AAU9KUB5_9STRA|nr:unnamed protein product [Peronospora belbahrii]CAH0516872.1 unnamed protein product [Peronospora belbahrii]